MEKIRGVEKYGEMEGGVEWGGEIERGVMSGGEMEGGVMSGGEKGTKGKRWRGMSKKRSEDELVQKLTTTNLDQV